jgi:6-pyruvoyltetrahydropterin/6-carboxytetrahydropterin synthase
MPDFRIRIAGDDLTFSSGHFITLPDGQCERLHGHTYRVSVEVRGPLDEGGCVVDFLTIRAALKPILAELDHRMLLPSKHPEISISCMGEMAEAHRGDRRWSFPKCDCALLPIANTTTELLAMYLGRRLASHLRASVSSAVRLRIELGEGSGCSSITPWLPLDS